MLIGGLQKSSLIDYPEKISAVIFTQGCNFRCPYCHNPELINLENKKSNLDSFPSNLTGEGPEENKNRILDFLSTRQGKLDGVVITGGEPTLHKDLPIFIKEIKSLGFCVKLDTNGTNPNMLQKLLDEKLVDYVAMDIKAPIEKYEQITNSKINTKEILRSIELIKLSKIKHEFRTTIVKSQLSNEDFEKIGSIISGCDKYYMQKFVPTKTLNTAFLDEKTYSDEDFEKLTQVLKKHIKNVLVR